MPARVKQESADVDGNKYIVSGSDHNRHDSEIRAIEKLIGVPSLPVSGFSGALDPCSMVNVLLRILSQLQVLRDSLVSQTSGVVAIMDDDIVGVDGLIPFPDSFSNTTLVSEVPDDSILDEEDLAPIDEIELADVDGMPDEGYVTIINDESTSPSFVLHSTTLQIISPASANAKVGKDFIYEIVSNIDAIYSAANLPAGLSLNGSQITGQPTGTGSATAVITASASGQQTTFNLQITTVAADTPVITSSLPVNGMVGAVFSYTITFTGVPNRVVTTGLPGGVTNFGQIIAGTPREAGVYNIPMTISDEFGDSDTKTLVLTVS